MSYINRLATLREAMEAKGITIKKLADFLNLPYTKMYIKLSGEEDFTLNEAIRVRDRFFPNVDIAKLFRKGVPAYGKHSAFR